MFNVPLAAGLRIVAVSVVGAGSLEYLLLGVFLPPPFIVAGVLLALSLAVGRWSRVTAALVVLLSVLVPVGALLGHLNGELIVAVPIFDTIVFGWLLVCALPVARGSV